MTQLSITTNAPLVRQGLEDFSAEIPKIGRRRIYNTMLRIQALMKKYPAQRKNQKYIRTYRLRSGWKIVSKTNGYMITNSTPYTPFVVGDAYGNRQAWMHISTDQGKRWSTLRDTAESEVEKLPAEIEDEINIVKRRYEVK